MFSPCAEFSSTKIRKVKEVFSLGAELSNTKDKTRNTKGRIYSLPVLNYPTQKIRKETKLKKMFSLCAVLSNTKDKRRSTK